MTNNISNNDGENSENLDGKVQIFSNTDEKLKFLGKILNNDSSRNILLLLIEKEMTANEIAIKMNLSLPLTLYHINQMMQAGIVSISKTGNNGKNQPMKYYSAKSGILILPEKTVETAKNSKSLSKSLKGIMKFAAIGITGIFAWFSTSLLQEELNDYQDWGPHGISIDQVLLPIAATIVTIVGLYWLIIKKKKRG